jgi:hypothetical protein
MRHALTAVLLVAGVSHSALAGKTASDGSRRFSLSEGLKRIPQAFRPTRERTLNGRFTGEWSIPKALGVAGARLSVRDVKVGDYVSQTHFHGLVQKVTADRATGKHFIRVQYALDPKTVQTFELRSGDDTIEGVHALKRPAR